VRQLAVFCFTLILSTVSFAATEFKHVFVNHTDYDLTTTVEEHKSISHPGRFALEIPAHSKRDVTLELKEIELGPVSIPHLHRPTIKIFLRNNTEKVLSIKERYTIEFDGTVTPLIYTYPFDNKWSVSLEIKKDKIKYIINTQSK